MSGSCPASVAGGDIQKKRTHKAVVDNFWRLLIVVKNEFRNHLGELWQGTAQNFDHVFKNK